MDKSKPVRPGKIVEITAVSNPRVKNARSLALKKNRDLEQTFLVEGFKLVRDAFESGWEINTLIYYPNSTIGEQAREFAAQARVAGAEIWEVNEKVLTSITRRDNPQMVVGILRQRWSKPPEAIDDTASVWIGLDRVRDPGNLGTIIRTADASGADGVILIGDTTDPYSLEASRASMGSIFNVPLAKLTEEAFLSWRPSWNGIVVGTHLDGAVDYRSIDYHTRAVLLLMGNEQKGLPENLAKSCDELALIPMNGAADSLNLAIATGVMLFQMGKRLPPLERFR